MSVLGVGCDDVGEAFGILRDGQTKVKGHLLKSLRHGGIACGHKHGQQRLVTRGGALIDQSEDLDALGGSHGRQRRAELTFQPVPARRALLPRRFLQCSADRDGCGVQGLRAQPVSPASRLSARHVQTSEQRLRTATFGNRKLLLSELQGGAETALA